MKVHDLKPAAGSDHRGRDLLEAGQDRVGVGDQLEELGLLTGLRDEQPRARRCEHRGLGLHARPGEVGDEYDALGHRPRWSRRTTSW